MKLFNSAVCGASLLALTAGMASAADDNLTYVDQNGTGNVAAVTQSGNNNEAGASGLAMTQSNFQNNLSILQSGNNNDIGLEGSGVTQNSNRSTPGDIGNTLTIVQSSSFNTVGSVAQTSTGTNTTLGVNSASITQAGLGGNRVGDVTQIRGSSTTNSLVVNQEGTLNTVETIYQRGTLGGNQTNSINVSMAGVGNGRESQLDLFADIAGVSSSALRQGANTAESRGNTMILDISGAANDFGVTQDGRNNSIGTLTMAGIDNQVGIRQDGNGNLVSLSTIAGVGNNIGIAQYQDGNLAGVNVSGNANRLGVLQDGDNNTADVSVTGDNNGLAYNSFSFFGVPIYTSADSLDNPAASVALLAGFELGRVTQFGDNNDVDLNIDGNNNLFGTLQDGVGNSIDGSVAGNNNQFAVAQVGASNATTFTQTGSGNNLAVSQ